MKLSTALSFIVAAGLSSLAWGHAHLKQQTPAQGATVAAPAELRLAFSEGVEPAFSEVTLVDGAGDRAPTQLSRDAGDATVLVAIPAAGLHAGIWTVHWKVVSVDTHRSEGQYTFTVR